MTMARAALEKTARAIVADGKGILAADETVPTLTKRLVATNIESTADSRRAYRELFFTTPGISRFISGVIMQDETIRQRGSTGTPLVDVLAQQGVVPGIKVDKGAKPLAGSPGSLITEGLDGQDEALEAWQGKSENVRAGQLAFYHRAQCDNAAALGRYGSAMESESAFA